MAWTWTNTATTGEKGLTALVAELQNACKQLAADIYTAPANGGDGAADLATPLQSSLAYCKAGAATSAGIAGAAVAFGTAMPNTNYHVSITWTGTLDGDIGLHRVAKTTAGFTLYTQGETACAFTWSVHPYQNE